VVHEHPGAVVMVSEPLPPEREAVMLEGVTVKLQLPAVWTTVNVFPAIISVPDRDVVPA
jgi:hypothetical protein